MWHVTPEAIRIYRDRYGVPSIDAGTMADAAYGVGHAMARDCGTRMAQMYLSARGRSAEVVGPVALQMDYLVRALDIEGAAKADMSTMPQEIGAIVDGFCAGANRSIAERRGFLPEWVRPIDPVDVLALVHLSNIAFPLLALTMQLTPGSGSNQFAVAPRHTANGNAIVSLDPHLDWDKAISWYEFAQYTPEGSVRGVAVCGVPLPIMGHNSRVGWSMTNNDPMLYGLFTLMTSPQPSPPGSEFPHSTIPAEYSYHGEWRKFEDVEFEIGCVDANGRHRTERMPARLTDWGPAITVDGVPCALHLPLVSAGDTLSQALAMMRASTTAEFLESLEPLGLTMWNFVAADIDGEIGYRYNARVHRRDPGFDWSKPVPGHDPRTKWGDPIPLDELPRVDNPAGGILVNANSSPWLTSISGEIPADPWPAYVTSHPSTFRYRRLAELLSASQRLTPERAMEIATDTLTPAGVEARRHLIEAAGDDAGLADAVRALRAWDRRSDLDSRGAALYFHWLMRDRTWELAAKLLDGDAWSPVDVELAVDALREAVASMRLAYGTVDVAWGDIHVSRRAGLEAPVIGFPHAVAPNTGPMADGKVVCDFGSSYRMVVELDPVGVRSWSAKPYGNALDPSSPHFVDQMALFGRGEYKDTLFGLDRIRAEAASVEELER